jgi:hypothetical protein
MTWLKVRLEADPRSIEAALEWESVHCEFEKFTEVESN